MPITITLEEAQAKLPELIASLPPGEDVVITRNAEPVAELHLIAKQHPRPQFGNCQGMLTIESEAEDEEHLKDFKE
jgi:antitoxin (DNA-binding transcriptional repressor) of toxin-antitoxin stability system